MEPPEARWWRPLDERRILCTLCPHSCRMEEGEAGYCAVRRRNGDKLRSLSYGRPTGFAVDPIEKKPLFHFMPGTQILSFGTLGCTLGCKFCQNWPYSHPDSPEPIGAYVPPEQVVRAAERQHAPSIAYTYNEPTVFAEYMVDIAHLARAKGIRNVAVTNGYITPQARREVFADLDAANVDLKGFSEDFYRDQTGGHLRPVLDTLEYIRKETNIWLEITTLLIPGLNDADAMLNEECTWIAEHLGNDVPVHFTAFHPDFQMHDRPATPPETLQRAREIAKAHALRFVYTGNIIDDEGLLTRCPECGEVLIARTWMNGRPVGLEGSRCKHCGASIAGVFTGTEPRSS